MLGVVVNMHAAARIALIRPGVSHGSSSRTSSRGPGMFDGAATIRPALFVLRLASASSLASGATVGVETPDTPPPTRLVSSLQYLQHGKGTRTLAPLVILRDGADTLAPDFHVL